LVLSEIAISQTYTGRLNRAPEAEMAYRKALSMSQQEPERRYLTRRLAELQNNNFRALSKSGFAKRLRA
jgi:predicted RNA polymerase sigma factor